MENYVVSLENISKSYRIYQSSLERFKEALHPLKKKYHTEFFALNSINISIPAGQSLGIIGFNGSGKSTLLKVICGILQPTCGALVVKGKISALLELGFSFNIEYTGRQNVYFTGSIFGYSKAEIQERYQEIIEFADIGDFLDQPVKTYSSGMLVRLAFAVAINVSPDILILDEALAVGDIRFQQKCVKRIRELQKKCTVIMVSHDLNALLTLCERIIWLHNGKIMEDGHPKKVIQKYTQAVYEGVEEDTGLETGKKESEAEKEHCETIPTETPDKRQPFSFGLDTKSISTYRLISTDRGATNAVWGGENVILEMSVRARQEVKKPILGFEVRNRLGVELFGFNTTFHEREISGLHQGEKIKIAFRFKWPHLTPSIYTINLAFAEDINNTIIQHHYLNDALIVESLNSIEMTGLFGVEKIEVDVTYDGP
jgi:lipopolysaccharide transport system ATP-binding protein